MLKHHFLKIALWAGQQLLIQKGKMLQLSLDAHGLLLLWKPGEWITQSVFDSVFNIKQGGKKDHYTFLFSSTDSHAQTTASALELFLPKLYQIYAFSSM